MKGDRAFLKVFFFCVFSIVLTLRMAWAESERVPLVQDQVLTRFTLGSCNKQNKDQPLWDEMIRHEPQFFMWMGDNIYGDTEDMDILRQKYQTQLNQPGYKALLSTTPVIGTWDDHDYGANNSGSNYPMREESQEEFLNFIGEPAHSERWSQEGVYTSYEFGPENQKVKVILLDTRYHWDVDDKKGSDILALV
jgi:alkaline phosphatase D